MGYHIDGYDTETPAGVSVLDDIEANSEPAEDGGSFATSDRFNFWKPGGRKKKTASSKHSLSEYWGGRFGGFGGWFGGARNSKLDAQTKIRVNALSAVRRIGAIVFGSDEKKKFSYAEGAKITLDHKMLDDETLGWTDGRKVDAVMGNALAAAGMQRYGLDKYQFERACGGRSRIEALIKQHDREDLYYPVLEILKGFRPAANWIYSTKCITSEFPGYGGYFDTEREFRHTAAQKAEIQARVNALIDHNKNLTAAAVATLWNSLAPEFPLETPWPDEVDAASRALREGCLAAESASDIGNAVVASVAELMNLLDEEDEDQQDQQDGSGGDGEGKPSGASASDTSGVAGPSLADLSEKLGLSGDKVGLDDDEARTLEDYAERGLTEEEATGLLKEGLQYHGHPASLMSIWGRSNAHSYAWVKSVVQPLISRTRESLKFRNEQARMDDLGLRRGLLDEGALHKLAFGDPRVFRRQDIISAPKVHIGLLVDESGSMRYGGSGSTGAEIARQCAVLLQAACHDLPGVSTSIWGHTANGGTDSPGGFNERGVEIFRYLERNQGDVHALGDIQGRNNNLDGFAIAYAGKRMLDLSEPGEQKILLVLADGYPAGEIVYAVTDHAGSTYDAEDDYCSECYGGGESGTSHTRKQIERLRANGIQVYLLGMGDAFRTNLATEMYGAGNFQLITKIADTPKVVSTLLQKALKDGSL